MIEQKHTFEHLLENEREEWTHNYFKPVSTDFIEHLKNTKYFSTQQYEKLWPKAWLQIYKLPKGVGKTYDMFRIIRDCYKKGEKFIILRWSRAELSNFKAEMNHEKQFPFYIAENGNVYNQKKTGPEKVHIGMIGYVKGNGLVPFRSLQFSDYSTVIVDEYVEPPLSSSKKEKETNKEIVRAFIKFLLDVQRAKKELKCYLFGNSNNLSDPFFDYFKLDYTTNLAYDEKAGVLVVQLGGGYYTGSLEKARAMSLLKYDEELELFIKQNKPTDSQRRLLPYSITRKCNIEAQFVIGSGINNA
ncbi:MAG: hypothetical protein E7Y34_02305, partial [Mycoplasma sp.]|nr:hypothetical protein [Mycoplasma sp.]